MKKNTIKILLILISVILIFNNCAVLALGDPIADPDAYKPGALGEEERLFEMGGRILGVINTIGIVLSVIILMVIGIQYMVGSVSEKAEYKKRMVPYLTGVILLFAATTIPNIVYTIINAK